MRLHIKTIITILLFISATISVKADEYENSLWAIGVQGGFNLSNKFNDKAWGSKIGYNTQIFIDRKLDRLFFIRAGFGYSTKGATFNNTTTKVDDDVLIKEKTKLTREVGYLHAPLSLGTHINFNEDFTLNLLIGGYLAYGVSFKNTHKLEHTGNSIENNSKKEIIKGQKNTYIKKGDFGVSFIFEGEYKNFLLGVSYEQGLRNVSINGNGNTHYSKWKNRNGTIYVGYKHYFE